MLKEDRVAVEALQVWLGQVVRVNQLELRGEEAQVVHVQLVHQVEPIHLKEALLQVHAYVLQARVQYESIEQAVG